MQTTRNVTFLIFPAEDAPGQWIGVCQDFDMWTFGGSVAATARLLRDAVLTTLDAAPVEALRPVDPERWRRLLEGGGSRLTTERIGVTVA
jgi:hypothetical protein